MPRKPAKDDTVYLADMLKAAQAVASFAANKSLADFENDLLLRSAIERQIEIIGEAARNVSKAKRVELVQIAWTGIIAQRHVLAHEYGEIVAERVWRVASIHVHTLIEQLMPIVPKVAGGRA